MKNLDIETVEIKETDLLEYTKEDWKLYHEYRIVRHTEANPDDPFTDNESTEKVLRMQCTHPEFNLNFLSIIDKSTNKFLGRVIYGGFRETSASYEGNKHLLQFDLVLLKEYRNKGIEKRILKKLVKYAKEKGFSLFVTGTDDKDGKAFLEEIGAQIALAGVENRLKLDEVDWNMITTWANEGPKQSPNTELKLVEKIPDDIIEKYSKVYTETMNQQPLGDLDVGAIVVSPEFLRDQEKRREELGRTHLTFYTIEQDGVIS
ncbi:GNAT family N-acetyltransferase, partial [Candidatus Heimdallarchaeota archaeon]